MHLHRYEELSQAPDLDTFRRLLVQAAADLEFPLVNFVLDSYTSTRTYRLVETGNVPLEFWDEYADEKLSLLDPVNAQLRAGTMIPFAYDQSLYEAHGVMNLWDQQAAHGYKCGIALALRLPQNRRQWLGLDRDFALPKDGHLTHLMGQVQLLAAYAQAGAQRLVDDAAPVRCIELTHTEKEILRWVSERKSSWEIGRILNVSENTVNWHVSNVLRKTDTRSRLEAALLSKSLGLLAA